MSPTAERSAPVSDSSPTNSLETCSASRVTTADEAKSPAVWPPIPSATAKIGERARRLSSLTLRRYPLSLSAAQARLMRASGLPGTATVWRLLLRPIWVTRVPLRLGARPCPQCPPARR